MKPLNWDRLDDLGMIKGPIYVPIEKVTHDPAQVSARDLRYYLSTNTQNWYAQPLTCIIRKTEDCVHYEANGVHTHTQVEACRKLGYRELLICYVKPAGAEV